MKNQLIFLLLIAAAAFGCQTKEPSNWAERLGYGEGKKVIILHADDAGMCDEANIATQKMLKNDEIQSAAVMVPCPNAEEMILWAKANPHEDVGVHLTLTAEWKEWRWSTLVDSAEVPGLIDPDGMMWHSVEQVVMSAKPAEVEKEIRAQIAKFRSMGIEPGHIDTHMGTLYAHPEYIKVFFKVAMETGIPANAIDLSNPEVVEGFRSQGYPLDDSVVELANSYTLPKVDNFTSAPNGTSYEDKIEKFKELVLGLKPGITEIIFHPSVGTENLKSITGSWQQRIWESQMFADPDLQAFFKEQGIIFTNWKEMMKRFDELDVLSTIVLTTDQAGKKL